MWLYTRRGALGMSLRAANLTHDSPLPVPLRTRIGTQRYRLIADTPQAPWSNFMCTKSLALLGTDRLGNTTISLLSSSLAPSTYANYDSALRHYFLLPRRGFASPKRHPNYDGPLHCLARRARHRGREFNATLLFAVNKYFRDHQLPPIAVGDFLARVGRILEMQ
jgi:hypothetical protein